MTGADNPDEIWKPSPAFKMFQCFDCFNQYKCDQDDTMITPDCFKKIPKGFEWDAKHREWVDTRCNNSKLKKLAKTSVPVLLSTPFNTVPLKRIRKKELPWQRYPHIPNLEGSGKLRRLLLGKHLTWTIKEDGQNVTIWMRTKKYCKKKQEIVISSHNKEVSAPDIETNVRKCPQYETILKLIKDFPTYRIVGEYCAKGASITGIKTYTEDKLIIIDIYNVAEHKYLPYIQVYQTCYHYGLPVVVLFSVTRHRTLKDLDKWAHHVLEYCDTVKEYGKDEGMVARAYDENGEYVMVKVKLDIPLPIERRRIDNYPPTLPHIPVCDIMGAISHVEADFGLDGTPAHDMPLIAKAVSEECRKHLYSSRGNLFIFYQKYMERKKQ